MWLTDFQKNDPPPTSSQNKSKPKKLPPPVDNGLNCIEAIPLFTYEDGGGVSRQSCSSILRILWKSVISTKTLSKSPSEPIAGKITLRFIKPRHYTTIPPLDGHKPRALKSYHKFIQDAQHNYCGY